MPYIHPSKRQSSYYTNGGAKIATTTEEAQAMSREVMGQSQNNVISSMVNAPEPKLAISSAAKVPTSKTLAALQESRKKPAKPIAAGSFGSMLPTTPRVKPPKVSKPKVVASRKVKMDAPQVERSQEFEDAKDALLRTLFEADMSTIYRIGSAHKLNFDRRSNGSYKNERLESRFQGFKLNKVSIPSGEVTREFEDATRIQFEIAMKGVKRIASANVGDFTRRANGSYRNERLESRFQGFLMGVLNTFSQSVLDKIVENRVTAIRLSR